MERCEPSSVVVPPASSVIVKVSVALWFVCLQMLHLFWRRHGPTWGNAAVSFHCSLFCDVGLVCLGPKVHARGRWWTGGSYMGLSWLRDQDTTLNCFQDKKQGCTSKLTSIDYVTKFIQWTLYYLFSWTWQVFLCLNLTKLWLLDYINKSLKVILHHTMSNVCQKAFFWKFNWSLKVVFVLSLTG